MTADFDSTFIPTVNKAARPLHSRKYSGRKYITNNGQINFRTFNGFNNSLTIFRKCIPSSIAHSLRGFLTLKV